MNNPKLLQQTNGLIILVTLALAVLSWIAAIVLMGVLSRSALYTLLTVLAAAAGLFGLYKYLAQSSYERNINRLTVLLMGIGLILALWTFNHIHLTWAWLVLCLLQVFPVIFMRQDKINENRRMDIHLYGRPQTDADRMARAVQATTMRDYASALGLNYIPASGPVVRPRAASQFAARLTCQHCSQPQAAREWPVNGDMVPFYHQKEPGKYSLKMTCPNCGKDWYVTWDQDPGQILPLS
jgi:hypothetical protein